MTFTLVPSGDLTYSWLDVNWDYGNGQTLDAVAAQLSKQQPIVYAARYTTVDIGSHTVQARLSNLVSNLTLTKDISVQATITGLTLVADQYIIETGTVVTFTMGTETGSHVAFRFYGAEGLLIYESPVLQENSGDALEVTHQYTFATPGEFQHVLNASNNVSHAEVELGSTIQVQNRIQQVTISVTNPVPIPTGTMTIDILYEGDEKAPPTSVTCLLKVDDIPVSSTQFPELVAQEVYPIEYQFPNLNVAGRYLVDVTCSNLINSQDFSEIVDVQRRIDGVTLTMSRTYIAVAEVSLLDMNIMAGSNLSIRVEAGDGNEELITLNPLFDTPRQVQHTHQYAASGIYKPKVKVWNLINVINDFTEVRVLEPVTGLRLWTYYYILDYSPEVSNGTGPNGDVIPQERKLQVRAFVGSGNGLSYTWNFGDGTTTTTNTSHTQYKYNKTGIYTVSLLAKNALYEQLVSVTIKVGCSSQISDWMWCNISLTHYLPEDLAVISKCHISAHGTD